MSQILLRRYIQFFCIFAITGGLAVNLNPALTISDYIQLHPSIQQHHIDDIVLSAFVTATLLLIGGVWQTRRLYAVSLKLIKQQSRHKIFLDRMPVAIVEFDSKRNIRLCNETYKQFKLRIGSIALNEVIEELFSNINSSPSQSQASLKQWVPDSDIHNSNKSCIGWLLQKVNNQYLLLGRDISQQQDTLSKLSISEKVLENTPIGVMVTGADQIIQYVNQAFLDVTGYASDEALGQPSSLLSSGVHDDDFYKLMYKSLAKDGCWQGEIWNRKKNGTIYLEWLSVIALKDDLGRATHYIGMFSEITAQEIVRKKLHALAYCDSLTSLANRAFFNDQLQHRIQNRGKKKLCVVFIDIDGFKRINDSLGHQIGDQLLIAIARRLKGNSREIDLVARWGGDEFIIAIEVSDHHLGISTFCNKHLNRLKQPYLINNRELSITASIGVSVYGDDANNASELIQNADIAMFQSKKQGKNRFEIFSQPLHEELLENVEIENRLRHAIRNNQINVHFQPQINTEYSEIYGFEALARWYDETLGNVSPQKFIRVAEETGIINELSRVIFSKALQQFKELQERSPDLVLSLNLSASQLQDEHLSSYLKEVTEKFRIEPSKIKLEITEDILMSDIQQSIDSTSRLKRMGFKISLDDFGTGYSSLSYLKDLDIDEIKIDRSFVTIINSSERNRAIVSAIVAMSEVLGINCIIEGVETEGQLSELQQIGSTRFQGYLFYKPLPFDEIFKLLNRNPLLKHSKS